MRGGWSIRFGFFERCGEGRSGGSWFSVRRIFGEGERWGLAALRRESCCNLWFAHVHSRLGFCTSLVPFLGLAPGTLGMLTIRCIRDHHVAEFVCFGGDHDLVHRGFEFGSLSSPLLFFGHRSHFL